MPYQPPVTSPARATSGLSGCLTTLLLLVAFCGGGGWYAYQQRDTIEAYLHAHLPHVPQTAASGTAANYDVSVHARCSSRTGSPTRCTLTVHNATDSSGTFRWTGASEPSGAQFTPSAGSVSRGSTSAPITVVVPDDGICPVLIELSTTDGTTVTSRITTVDGQSC